MSALPYVVDLLLGAACVWLLLTALEALSPRRRCSTCLHRADPVVLEGVVGTREDWRAAYLARMAERREDGQ